MNLLNRDVHQLIDRAARAGCVEQVRKMIDGALWSNWGPQLRRKIERFIKGHEEGQHPIGIIFREGKSSPRATLLPPGAWKGKKR